LQFYQFVVHDFVRTKTGSSLRLTGGRATKFGADGGKLPAGNEMPGGKKVLADATITHGLIYRHTRQAPSSHWARPT
jgi:hypothetical protein